MPSGKDVNNLGRRGTGGTTKKNAFCSFCRKSYRDVGPLVEGPGDVYICGECIELCQSILDQEKKRRGTSKQLFSSIPSPREKGFAPPYSGSPSVSRANTNSSKNQESAAASMVRAGGSPPPRALMKSEPSIAPPAKLADR